MYYVVINHYHNTILGISSILNFDYPWRMQRLQAISITRIEYPAAERLNPGSNYRDDRAYQLVINVAGDYDIHEK